MGFSLSESSLLHIISTLKREVSHVDDNIFVIGSTRSCQITTWEYSVTTISPTYFRFSVSVHSSHTSTYHYNDVIMTTMSSQITSLTVVYSTVYSDADQRKHQSSGSLAFVRGIHRYRWIPRTKGQLRGKCFHLIASSWCRRSAIRDIDGLVQERRNSSALAMGLCLSYTNASIWEHT